jgi:hypothetical protein
MILAGAFGLAATASAGTYSGGTGEPNNPYQIETPNDLNDIGNHPEDWGSYFVMVNDVNLAEYTGTQFNMIGISDTDAFTGVFDGNSRKIYNFSYSSTDKDLIGIFGYVKGPDSEIKNISIIDPNIDAGNGIVVGGLIGGLRESTVKNCHVTSGKIQGGGALGGLIGVILDSAVTDCGVEQTSLSAIGGGIGGLAGRADNSVVTDCYADCNIISDDHVGGLVGFTDMFTDYINCYATGNVQGDSHVGGLIGECMHGEPESPIVSNCYATGDVNGQSCTGGLIGSIAPGYQVLNCYATGDVVGAGETGGLIGSCHGDVSLCYAIGDVKRDQRTGGFIGASNNGSMSDCYAKGDVQGNDETGGFIGWNDSQTITNAFSSGSVSGNNYTGGFVGRNWSTLIKCFWDNTVNPTLSGIGSGTDPNVIGKSTAEMMQEATFDNWDFVEVWDIGENQTYPFLRTYSAGDLNHDGIVDLHDFAILALHWLEGTEP